MPSRGGVFLAAFGTSGEETRGRVLLVYLPVALLALVCYVNTLRSGFVFDDHALILSNPRMHPPFGYKYLFNPRAYHKIADIDMDYRPIPNLLTRLEVDMWEIRAAPMRATNLLLHVSVCLLVVYTAFLLGFDGTAALAAGLLFASHPVHAEAVAWIKCRAELLASLFALCALVFHLHRSSKGWNSASGISYALLTAVCVLAALLCKKTYIFIIPLCILAAWIKVTPADRMRELVWGIFLLGLGLLFIWLDRRFLSPERIYDASKAATSEVRYLCILTYTIPFYVAKFFWPSRLSVLHDFPPAWVRSEPWSETPGLVVALAVCWLILVAVTVGALILHRKRPRVFISWSWFLVGILPVSNLIVISGRPLAVQRLYLPSAGLCLLAGLLCSHLWQQKVRWAVGGVLAGLLVWMSAQTVRLNHRWRSDESLWLYEMELRPDHSKPWYALGLLAMDAGDLDTACVRLEKAFELAPEKTEIRGGLALAYFKRGDAERAELFAQSSLRVFPRSDILREALARIYMGQGRYEEAEEVVRWRVERKPEDVMLRHQYAEVLAKLDRLAEAEQELRMALQLHPELSFLHHGLGNVLEARGDWNGAIRAYRMALDTDSQNVLAGGRLVGLLRQSGRIDEAIEEGVRLAEGDPTNAVVRNDTAALILAATHIQSDQLDLALRLAQEAVALTERSDPYCLGTLALAYRRHGEVVEALETERQALALLDEMPSSPERDQLRAELVARFSSPTNSADRGAE